MSFGSMTISSSA